jgi:hypothetical protein
VAADLATLMASLVRVDFAVGELVLLRTLVGLVVFTAAAVLFMVDVSILINIEKGRDVGYVPLGLYFSPVAVEPCTIFAVCW